MSRLRIAVLNAAHRDANTTRNFRRELDASLAEFDVTSGELPSGYDYDGAVVTGSRSSVYWDEPWIPATKEWVAEAIDRDVPFLGVCWGHQLLADVLGGSVANMGVYELGYSEVEHTGDSRLFDGIDRRFTVFTSHRDAVTALPPGAESLAENDYSNHGFRADRVFGVQFHPEYDRKTARELVARKEIREERRAAVLAEITDENEAKSGQAKLVFDNFLAFVEEVRESDAGAEAADAARAAEPAETASTTDPLTTDAPVGDSGGATDAATAETADPVEAVETTDPETAEPDRDATS